jgi:hypothetical protein
MFVDFGFRHHVAACAFYDMFENAPADIINRFGAVDNAAGQQIQVISHSLEDW